MEISVIVPTYNRNHQILNLLNSLERQSYQEFEVIVVNDGSTDDTLSILHNYKRDTSLRLKIIDSENRGRSGSRNLGIKIANGDLIIFYDDDVRPNPRSVENHCDFHLKHDNALLAGPYLYDSSKFFNDFHFYRKNLEESWFQERETPTNNKSLMINGGNFSIRKEKLMAIGGFDERLNDKEDFNLSFSLYKKFDTKTYFFFNTWVFHDDFKFLHQYVKRGIDSRKEEQKLIKTNPEIQKFQPERFVCYPSNSLRAIIFKFFKIPIIIRFFSVSPLALVFPRNMRYKIYDYIITANIKYLNI